MIDVEIHSCLASNNWPYHLGSVQIDVDEPLETDPDTLVSGWWDSFQETEPESDSQFVEWLVKQGLAGEGFHDPGNPNNTPFQVYIKG